MKILVTGGYGFIGSNYILNNVDQDDNIILTGSTTVSAVNGNLLVYPRLFEVDINTLQYKQVFPNADYPEGPAEYILDGALEEFGIDVIDNPVISYNKKTDKYNVTYTASLSSEDGKSIYTVFTSDFRYKKLNLQLIDACAIHSQSTNRYVKQSPEWEDDITHKTISLPGEAAGIYPPDKEVKIHNMSLSGMLGYTLSGQSLTLNINTESIPVSSHGYKINKILVDYDDGGEIMMKERSIDVSSVGIDFDITDLPDPSDVGDPRRGGFEHKYIFNKSTPHIYTTSISAIYSDFSAIVYNINIETSPYTIDSGLGGLKLINSKLYTDTIGQHKQLITLESQNPRYVSNVVLTR